MRTSHHIVWGAASVATVLAVSSMLTAGPLTPPLGPVAETPGPEPRIAINAINTPGDTDATPSHFKITQPGSYYLESNVISLGSAAGIEIAASGVTLDLNGFELLGAPGSVNGIRVTTVVNNLRIHNGSVRGWGASGVEAGLARNAAVRDLVVSDNGSSGLRIGSGGLVEGCTARSNNSVGISAGVDSTVTGCTASLNGNDGIAAGAGSTITGCTASSNGDVGVSVDGGCTVSGCTVRGNGGGGVLTGIAATVSNCTAQSNGADGINTGAGSTISGCTAVFNTGDGIQVISDSLVVGNTCDDNGFNGDGAGIHATSSNTRIEGNTVTENDRGIDIDDKGNLVIRNSASANTVSYDIAVSNTVGPIVTGATIVTNPNPHANYEF